MKHTVKRYNVFVGGVLVGRGYNEVKLMEYAINYAVKHNIDAKEIEFKEVDDNEYK